MERREEQVPARAGGVATVGCVSLGLDLARTAGPPGGRSDLGIKDRVDGSPLGLVRERTDDVEIQ